MHDIAVVIPCYRRQEMLLETLEHLQQVIRDAALELAQVEVIVVDDASNPDLFIPLYPYHRLIRQDTNSGPAAARNAGVAAATAEWVCFLDSDDRLIADKLLAVHTLSNDVDAVIGGQLATQSDGRLFEIRNQPPLADLSQSLERGWIPNNPSSVLIRRAAYQSVGGMQSNLRSSEDHEFWLRAILKHGLNVMCVSTPFSVFQDIAPDRLSFNIAARKEGHRQFSKSFHRAFADRPALWRWMLLKNIEVSLYFPWISPRYARQAGIAAFASAWGNLLINPHFYRRVAAKLSRVTRRA